MCYNKKMTSLPSIDDFFNQLRHRMNTFSMRGEVGLDFHRASPSGVARKLCWTLEYTTAYSSVSVFLPTHLNSVLNSTPDRKGRSPAFAGLETHTSCVDDIQDVMRLCAPTNKSIKVELTKNGFAVVQECVNPGALRALAYTATNWQDLLTQALHNSVSQQMFSIRCFEQSLPQTRRAVQEVLQDRPVHNELTDQIVRHTLSQQLADIAPARHAARKM